MKAIVQLSPNLKIEIEAEDEMEVLHKGIVLSNPRKVCNECQGKATMLISSKDTEGNTYVNNLCLNCGARSKLGQYKTKGYFWRDFEKWERKLDKSEK